MVVGARARAGRRRIPRHAGGSVGHAGRHVLRADRRRRRPYALLAAAGCADSRAELAARAPPLTVMPVRSEIHEGLVPVKVYTGELEPAARQQLVNISKLPI